MIAEEVRIIRAVSPALRKARGKSELTVFIDYEQTVTLIAADGEGSGIVFQLHPLVMIRRYRKQRGIDGRRGRGDRGERGANKHDRGKQNADKSCFFHLDPPLQIAVLGRCFGGLLRLTQG